jgi:hypothetical protein
VSGKGPRPLIQPGVPFLRIWDRRGNLQLCVASGWICAASVAESHVSAVSPPVRPTGRAPACVADLAHWRKIFSHIQLSTASGTERHTSVCKVTCSRAVGMSFQITTLKVLAGYP